MRNEELAKDIEDAIVPTGRAAVWWIGQHSFVVKSGTTILYIDPFLSPLEGRLIPPLLEPARVTHATLIIGSHDHADHIDRGAWPALAKASPRARFVVPELLREGLARDLNIPIDRFAGIDDADTITLGDVRISAIASSHEFFDRDEATGRYPYLGFVVEVGGVIFYHPGDTVVYEGLLTRLKQYRRFDAMFLPINGRDAKRYKLAIIGNMTYQEAADLAGSCEPRAVIPTHYEMFALNLADPVAFTDYVNVKYPKQAVHICQHGQRFLIGPG